MHVENCVLKAFAFDIFLPDESTSRFYIFHDLAELFGEEFNYDALKRLKKLLAAHPDNPKGKLSLDQEADNVTLTAAKPEVICLVAQVINENCIKQYKTTYTAAEYEAILHALRSWKRPKPKKWAAGDFFAFELSNGELAFGQVLSKSRSGSAYCALLEAKSDEMLSVDDLQSRRVVSVLSLVYMGLLDKGVGKVIGSGAPVTPPTVSSRSFGEETLQDLAEAYFGLAPWNVGWCGDDCYYDKLLCAGIERPGNCLWLSDEERRAYRAKHGITA